MQRRLGNLRQHDEARVVTRHLTDNLTTDRARRTGDHDHLARDDLTDIVDIDMYLGALEQVLDLDGFDATNLLGHLLILILAEVGEVRRGEDAYVVVEEDSQVFGRRYVLHLQRRNDDILHLFGLEQTDDIIVLDIYLQSEQLVLDIVVGIRQEAYGTIRAVHAGVKHLCDSQSCGLRAVDHHRTRAGTMVRHILKTQFDSDTPAYEQHYAHEDIRVKDRVEHEADARGVTHNARDEHRHKAGGEHGKEHLGGIDERGESQDTRVGVEHPERQRLQHHQHSRLLPEG